MQTILLRLHTQIMADKLDTAAALLSENEAWGRLLVKLQEKYAATGQELDAYLEGLLYQDYLNYWDYIHTDTLLSLQTTRTQFPDEQIFIIYHQISELNFKMIRSELAQIAELAEPDEQTLLKRVRRCNRYFENLVSSFDVMSEGMDQDQFLRFRMALLPASGFQSAQFRLIEIASTDGWLLVRPDLRGPQAEQYTPAQVWEKMYWRQGATEQTSGAKTLTLRRFEAKYERDFQQAIEQFAATNLRRQYLKATHGNPGPELKEALLRLDRLVNLEWRLVHLKSAVRYLKQQPADLPATGGTNWQRYLPPHFQLNRFFPELGDWA